MSTPCTLLPIFEISDRHPLKKGVDYQLRYPFKGKLHPKPTLNMFCELSKHDMRSNSEFWAFWHKMVNYFWQSVDAILEDVSVAETIVWY